MIKDILTTGLMTIEGPIIGLVGGVVSAVVLGAIVDFVSGMGGG